MLGIIRKAGEHEQSFGHCLLYLLSLQGRWQREGSIKSFRIICHGRQWSGIICSSFLPVHLIKAIKGWKETDQGDSVWSAADLEAPYWGMQICPASRGNGSSSWKRNHRILQQQVGRDFMDHLSIIPNISCQKHGLQKTAQPNPKSVPFWGIHHFPQEMIVLIRKSFLLFPPEISSGAACSYHPLSFPYDFL